jgi:hypothetical protein
VPNNLGGAENRFVGMIPAVLLCLAHLTVTNTFSFMRLLRTSDREKEIEILADFLRSQAKALLACDFFRPAPWPESACTS